MKNRERTEYDSVISSYFGEDQVTAVINLKVETKDADVIAEAISEHANVEALYLVTGETDVVAVVRFQNYPQLKRFLMESSHLHPRSEGVEDRHGGDDLQGRGRDQVRDRPLRECWHRKVSDLSRHRREVYNMVDNVKLKQILDVLDQLAEDTSVPRNIRRGATDAKGRLLQTDEAMDVKAASATSILDELANDPNIPLHGRTLIWNIISQLETVR